MSLTKDWQTFTSSSSFLQSLTCSPLVSMIRNTSHRRKWKSLASLNLASIEEERGYDCGYLDLGAETPVSASSSSSFLESPGLVENWALRRPSSLLATSPITSRYKRYTVDRDCGIWYVLLFLRFVAIELDYPHHSFEYAVVPCRTLCCGKIFCTEHLADVRLSP